ncbi:hypothetical protein L1987_48813 [Smallanthus sonchifolius]|uniref:Uncharacterized protein n=1 Tax=Smallanthus sonchifolius TaxID=185202 RepID=A0ACB9FTV3_9ASTR|nr:hypothetical protein L1987_48813 [Smallanthus sonchifolius]
MLRLKDGTNDFYKKQQLQELAMPSGILREETGQMLCVPQEVVRRAAFILDATTKGIHIDRARDEKITVHDDQYKNAVEKMVGFNAINGDFQIRRDMGMAQEFPKPYRKKKDKGAEEGLRCGRLAVTFFKILRLNIEMISMDSLSSYTSRKDILRARSPPSPYDSLIKFKRIDSWWEIPIKDPLLQHAASAYLQPMSSEPDSDERCRFWKLKDCFCGFFRRG